MRHKFRLNATSESELKSKLLAACNASEMAAFLDSHNHLDPFSRFRWICAIGVREKLSSSVNSLPELRKFRNKHRDWLFGHISYELKNQLESLDSSNADQLQFPALGFFVPDHIVYKESDGIFCESHSLASEDMLIAHLGQNPAMDESLENVNLRPRIAKEEYLQEVESLKAHLQFGNIYEVNFCMEFHGVANIFPALSVFNKLNSSTQAPFSAFYKFQDQYCLCASPERYLQKNGSKLISQPMKGTAPRSSDLELDKSYRQMLAESEKERSENVMITDLVRNDLSRTAKKASVKVEELFGIYTFNKVHQMISTVSSELGESKDLEDVLQSTFPMGSMTGAPKYMAMQLIDGHENFTRSLYSGSIGYITPENDCDFNVVIRSIFYNARSHYVSARVGSAITIHCEAENEYSECLLKAEALLDALRP